MAAMFFFRFIWNDKFPWKISYTLCVPTDKSFGVALTEKIFERTRQNNKILK